MNLYWSIALTFVEYYFILSVILIDINSGISLTITIILISSKHTWIWYFSTCVSRARYW